jgi:hypothetical protein
MNKIISIIILLVLSSAVFGEAFMEMLEFDIFTEEGSLFFILHIDNDLFNGKKE